MPVMPFPGSWSALSSSAALAVMAPRVSRGALAPLARSRVVWELEKYAPAYVEQPGPQILGAAEAFVHAQLGDRADPDELLAVGLQHGSRVVSARGRRGHDHALAMAARAAASSNALYDPTAAWLLALRLRSKGMAAVDGPFGTVEVASDDLQLLGVEDLGKLVASVPDQGRMNERIRGWTSTPFPPDPKLEPALAYVCAAAVGADAADAPRLLGAHARDIVTAIASVLPGTNGGLDALVGAATKAFLDSPRADDRVLVRLVEDRIALLASLPRERCELVLRAVNALVQVAPITPVRREIVTVTMAVLALGKSAAFRVRALPG
ncbi:MAG: hypothetical protein IT379_05875 [Deltaproteobacteria bacterium]|nr:hypothetical protein [Deltaproteobacteria bacterium]